MLNLELMHAGDKLRQCCLLIREIAAAGCTGALHRWGAHACVLRWHCLLVLRDPRELPGLIMSDTTSVNLNKGTAAAVIAKEMDGLQGQPAQEKYAWHQERPVPT